MVLVGFRGQLLSAFWTGWEVPFRAGVGRGCGGCEGSEGGLGIRLGSRRRQLFLITSGDNGGCQD